MAVSTTTSEPARTSAGTKAEDPASGAAGGMPSRHIVALRWPAEAVEARRLAILGVPRLLLVQHGAEPPVASDGLQAWLRLPADGGELEAHLCTLASSAPTPRGPVRLDEHHRLFVGDRWVALTATQARIAAALVADFGDLVTQDRLLRAGWPDAPPKPNNLRVQLLRLRERLGSVGLQLQSVRGHGLILQRRP